MDWKLLFGFSVAGFAALSYAGLTSGSERRPNQQPATRQVVASSSAPSAAPAAPGKPSVTTAAATAAEQPKPSADAWTVPDVDKLPDDAWGRAVRLGRDLTVATYAHLGPEVADASKRYAGNNLSCQSCHLDAGTKKFGLPFVGVFGDFPQYRSREGEVGTIEDRVNGCMTRSMNGKPLPVDSTEMKAFVAYIKFVSTGRPVGGKTEGRGSGAIPELTRAANVEHGREVYAQACAACHQADGQGVRKGVVGDAQGYQFPPLWGLDSFNDGAGMNRLISAANFIHSNMPLGTSYDAPVVTAEDAWDVAAFIQSQQRPAKADLDKDFPNRLQKPVDAGYGPYVDGFNQDQHKLGPFQPIRDKIKALKQSAKEEAPAASN
jgi:thiosulfate dehydrogenase